MDRFDIERVTVSDGPFKGWLTWISEPFEMLTGPFYFRTEPDGSTRGAFIPDEEKRNGAGIVHGGALMTFADAFLGVLVYNLLDGQYTVTVTFNCEFLGAGEVNAPIYATGRLMRQTGSLAFVQAELEQSGRPIFTFSSVLKKFTSR
jgi:acyl-coenzyme A thioesterase 13